MSYILACKNMRSCCPFKPNSRWGSRCSSPMARLASKSQGPLQVWHLQCWRLRPCVVRYRTLMRKLRKLPCCIPLCAGDARIAPSWKPQKSMLLWKRPILRAVRVKSLILTSGSTSHLWRCRKSSQQGDTKLKEFVSHVCVPFHY